MTDETRQSPTETVSHVVKGWAVWHPTKGFDAYAYEGAIAYADIADDLLEEVTDLNETDGTDKITGWRIVAVNVTLADPKQLNTLQRPEGK